MTDDELEIKLTNIEERFFDIVQLIMNLYDAVEDLQQLADTLNSLYTDEQLATLGLPLSHNMERFEHARKKWSLKLKVNQVWPNFKAHFDEAWVDLRKLHGPTMKDTTYQQQVNLIYKEALASIQEERLSMTQELKQTTDTIH